MKPEIRIAALICGVTALFAAGLRADTLTLRNGETLHGTFLGGTARQVRMDLNGDIRTFDVGQVQSVTFSDPDYQPPPPRASSYPAPSGDGPRMRRAPGSDSDSRDADSRGYDTPRAAASPSGITIPVDTRITVRMIETVDSERSRLGQTFRASLDEPVMVGNQEVIPRGADVLTKLVTDQRSGSIQGRTILTLAISTITVNGQPLDVTTTDVQTASGSRGARTAGVVGGGAALGAIIGAIAGGGKGAAIGAGSGAVVGAGAEVLTGGQKVKIPSETRLTFRLQSPVQL
jgi:hypothetical protein